MERLNQLLKQISEIVLKENTQQEEKRRRGETTAFAEGNMNVKSILLGPQFFLKSDRFFCLF